MRKLLLIFTLILVCASLGLAQGQSHSGNVGEDRDDHDDNGPVQAGFAVITPVAVTTSSSTSGLVVFASFGMRHGNSPATQAGVLPPDLTTNAVMFVDTNRRLAKNLGVAIVNPNSSNVNVTLTLRKNDGTQLGTTNVNVPSHQHISKFITELFANQSSVPRDVTGMLAITSAGSSNLPVSVIGLRFRGDNFSTLPVTSLSGTTTPLPTIATGVGGPGAILIPEFAAGGGWATELVIANTGTSALTVRVDLFKEDGTPLTANLNGQTASSFTGLTIPAGGVIILAPRNTDGDDDF
ncbi:MAG TPA: hypothetical protein VE422_04165 [Terriglobia bacterium]|nr:hypothetical protein [Terriglobia bacterium]